MSSRTPHALCSSLSVDSSYLPFTMGLDFVIGHPLQERIRRFMLHYFTFYNFPVLRHSRLIISIILSFVVIGNHRIFAEYRILQMKFNEHVRVEGIATQFRRSYTYIFIVLYSTLVVVSLNSISIIN